ncbi:FxsA family protein [Microbulbifer agarilyticus]|uniref:FxsA family protein n=1 Tax=Microbulbifer agarilyticus TaxID=260552 RepID=UPI001C960EB1|nr:FxsA family protein [Microbulbifer agarilyticus]MBY6213252.1 FxsA family protein [Microbulbifer agarilyticus]
MRPFLLLFIIMPILEMWVLIRVGEEIGALPTIGLVLMTAVVGLALLKRQGLSTILRAQQKMAVGELPAQEMAEGIFLAVGGALLLTPGFITDAIGFACLIPGIRHLFLGKLLSHVVVVRGPGYPPGSDHTGGSQSQPGQFQPGQSRQGQNRSHDVIEGDFKREDSDKDQR